MSETSSSNLPSLDELVKQADDLQMMPQTARKVIDLVSKETSTAQDLANVIEKDANITTRILKIANSAFYGLRREVTTVQRAIVILGYKSVRSLTIASSSKAMHKRFGITEQLMWDHSVGTAIIGRILSKGKSAGVGEMAFVGGLLHNVGKAIMNNQCPEAYNEVMMSVYNDKIDYPEAEKSIFGYTYPEVGSRIIEKWGLPESIFRTIRYHHLSSLGPEERNTVFSDDETKMGLACVEMALMMGKKLGIGYREPHEDLDLAGLVSAEYLGLKEESFESLLPQAQSSFAEEKAIFE